MLLGMTFIVESENMSEVNIFGLWNLADGKKWDSEGIMKT